MCMRFHDDMRPLPLVWFVSLPSEQVVRGGEFTFWFAIPSTGDRNPPIKKKPIKLPISGDRNISIFHHNHCALVDNPITSDTHRQIEAGFYMAREVSITSFTQ